MMIIHLSEFFFARRKVIRCFVQKYMIELPTEEEIKDFISKVDRLM